MVVYYYPVSESNHPPLGIPASFSLLVKTRKHVTSHLSNAPLFTFSAMIHLLIKLYLCMNLIILAKRPPHEFTHNLPFK